MIASYTHTQRFLHLYDERCRKIRQIIIGNAPDSFVIGFTPTTIAVQQDGRIYTYDTWGRRIGSRPVGR